MDVFGGIVSVTLSDNAASVMEPQLSVARMVIVCKPTVAALLIDTTPAAFTLTVPL